MFSGPSAIVFDPTSGDLFVVDSTNSAIRKISLPSYAVTTVAGGAYATSSGSASYGTAGFQDGAGSSALFTYPVGISVDGSGNLYVADTFNHAIRKVAAGTYAVTTVAGGGGGNATNTTGTPGYANGAAATALFFQPFQVAVDGAGNLFVADTGNDVIREISAGTVTLFAGTAPTTGSSLPVPVVGSTDGAPGVATFGSPQDVIVTGSGSSETLYVADTPTPRSARSIPAAPSRPLQGATAAIDPKRTASSAGMIPPRCRRRRTWRCAAMADAEIRC